MITIDETESAACRLCQGGQGPGRGSGHRASRKRVQELEHTMSRPGFYDDADLSKKVFDEVGDLKGKLSRFEKLQACTMTPRP